MKSKIFYVIALSAFVFCWLAGEPAEGGTSMSDKAETVSGKIDLRVLYAGSPGSDRQGDRITAGFDSVAWGFGLSFQGTIESGLY